MKKRMLIWLILFSIFCSVCAWRFCISNPRKIQIIQKEIYFLNLPKSLDGTKILHLSDLHSWWFGGRERKILKIAEDFNPDFIFLTGDFIDLPTYLFDRRLKALKNFWKKLSQKFPNRVFGVLGNHDDSFVLKALEESGIEVLINESRKISFKNEHFYLIGVDDPWTKKDDLTKAMSKVPRDDSFKILLSHSPDVFKEATQSKINLVLAGHLHCGQIYLPIIGAIWVPSKYGQKYLKGLFKENSTYLYVSCGVGTSILPIRINSLPEMTLIFLKSYGN